MSRAPLPTANSSRCPIARNESHGGRAITNEKESFRAPQIGAIMLAALPSALVPALAPALLGALGAEGTLSLTQIGQAATLELCAMGIVAGVAGAWLKPHGLRRIGAAAMILSVALNLISAWLPAPGLMLARAANGACLGILLWLLTGMFARSSNPARITGFYISFQAIAALCMVAVTTSLVIPATGAIGGFILLAGLTGLLMLALPFMPAHYAPIRKDGPAGLPDATGWVAIASPFLYCSAITATWVYVDPLGRAALLLPPQIGILISVAIAMQIMGGWAASALATRLRPLPVILFGALLNIPVMLTLYAIDGFLPLIAALAVFGFLWGFVVSFQIAFVMGVDPSGRAALLVGSAQLLGGGSGPLLASFVVGLWGLGHAPLLSLLLAVTSALLALWCRRAGTATMPPGRGIPSVE